MLNVVNDMEQELQDRTNVVVDGGFDDNNIQVCNDLVV